MNLIFDLWIYSKDKLHETKILCKWNYKVVRIMKFLLHQSIVPKMFLVNALFVNPEEKWRLLKLQTNYMRNKSEEIHAYS